MTDTKLATVLLHSGLNLVKIDKTLNDYHTILYHQAIGKLLYIAIASHLDIAFTVAHLSHFTNIYDHMHWKVAKCIMHYLKGTYNQVLRYNRHVLNQNTLSSDPLLLVGYCNTDWSRCMIDRKSISSYIFTLADGPIMWAFKTQTIMALSSSEAKLNTLSEVIK